MENCKQTLGTIQRNKYGNLVNIEVDSDHLEKNWKPIMELGQKDTRFRYRSFPNFVRIKIEYEQNTLEFQAIIPGESALVNYLLKSNDFLYDPNVTLVKSSVYQFTTEEFKMEFNDAFVFDIMIYDEKFKLCSISSSI